MLGPLVAFFISFRPQQRSGSSCPNRQLRADDSIAIGAVARVGSCFHSKEHEKCRTTFNLRSSFLSWPAACDPEQPVGAPPDHSYSSRAVPFLPTPHGRSSDERLAGKERVRTCSTRWSQKH